MEIQVTNDAMRPLGGALGENVEGLRLDGYLAQNYPFLSRAGWQKRIEGGEVLVRGRTVRPAYRLRTGDQLHFYHPPQVEPEVDTDIYPIWRLGAVMAVYKPPNLPMHENGPYRHNTFSRLVTQELGPEWSAVHRLDRETSGIVLCGATAAVRQRLSLYLAKGQMAKEYLAIARGMAPQSKFREMGAIGDLKESPIRIKKWVVADGQPAETWFEVEAEKSGHVLLRAYPKTGRTNQIRIHAAFNSLPLVGDKLYHPDENVFLEVFEKGVSQHIIDKVGFRRLCLHATRLSFVHPETQQEVVVDCPMPPDMSEFWEQLHS